MYIPLKQRSKSINQLLEDCERMEESYKDIFRRCDESNKKIFVNMHLQLDIMKQYTHDSERIVKLEKDVVTLEMKLK